MNITEASFAHTHIPFHRQTRPSSPDEARTVPVTFQATRHTWAPLPAPPPPDPWSKWAGLRISSLVWPP